MDDFDSRPEQSSYAFAPNKELSLLTSAAKENKLKEQESHVSRLLEDAFWNQLTLNGYDQKLGLNVGFSETPSWTESRSRWEIRGDDVALDEAEFDIPGLRSWPLAVTDQPRSHIDYLAHPLIKAVTLTHISTFAALL